MKLLQSLILLLVASFTHAQFATDRVLTDNHITKPSRIITVDLNNDGEKDILTYSVEHEQLVWNRQNCSLYNWDASVLVSRNAKLTAITTGDIDLDGDIDIIAANDLSSNIVIFRNDGSGGFSEEETLIENEAQIKHLELADLDNDGDLDLAFTSSFQNIIAWYANSSGFGTFTNRTIIKTQFLLPREVIAADVDGDNDLDLIASGKDEIIWFENYNDGLFNGGSVIMTESASTRIKPVDFDKDGDLDILAGNFSADEINLYENEDGLGGYGDPIFLVSYPDIYGVDTEDLDGDNDYDIIVSSYIQEDEIVYFTQLETPYTFSEKKEISSNSGVFSFDVTDMNHDEIPDFVVPRYHDSEIIVVINHLEAEDTLVTYRVELGTNLICSIITADLDQDGYLDILSASNKLLWHRNLGEGDLSFEEIPLVPSTTVHDVKVFDGDLDNDMDIFYSTPSKVYWFENENGEFARETIGNGQHFAVGDINGDNYVDVVRAYVDIYFHLGGNSENPYDSVILIPNNFSTVSAIDLFDIDHDGDLDIIAGSIQYNSVYWFENIDGFGNFGEPITLQSEINNPSDFAFGDIDGDSDLDIIVPDFAYGEFNLFRNIEGTAEYEAFQEITTEVAGAHNASLADFDNDGDLDIVGTQLNAGEILWLINDGQGNFTEITMLNDESSLGANCLATGDLDEDGDIDIVAGFEALGYTESKFTLHENLLVDLFVDLDNDGFDETVDCDDTNPMINPCAIEIPDNDIDEDCSEFVNIFEKPDVFLLEVKIFPNPTRDIVILESESQDVKKYRLFNSTGQLMQESSFTDQLQIDLSPFLDGIYFIQISTNEGMNISKIIKTE